MMNNTHVMIALAAAIAVVAVAFVTINATTEPDVTVYTDEGVSAEVSQNALGQVVLQASLEDGYTFGGWYDSDWNLLSSSASCTLFLSGGASVYAFNSAYSVVDVGTAFDVAEALGASGNGTVGVSTSDEDGSEAEVDGTSVTLPSVGLYRVCYTAPDGGHVCHSFLGDEGKSITYSWTYSTSVTPAALHFKNKTTSGDYSLTVSVSYADYRHYLEAYDKYDRYSYYTNKEETDENIARDVSYVAYDTVQDTYLSQIASYIGTKTSGKSDQYVANVILSFVQSLEYKSDSEVYGISEYWQFPLETLYLGSGDCEDTSILFCAIAEYMGYDSALFLFTNHMGAGINLDSFTSSNRNSSSIYSGAVGWNLTTGTDEDGEEVTEPFYYGETTATGWLIGEIPASSYSNYITGFAVGYYSDSSATTVNIVSEGVASATATNGSGSMTTLTAKVAKGTEFYGWYDSEGNLISENKQFSRKFADGDTVYVFAGGPANKDFPVAPGATVSLSEITGITGSGTWHVINDNADAPGSEYAFGSSGRYIVSYTDGDTTWHGLVFVHADVTVYTSEGVSATVTSNGRQTTITAEVEDGIDFNGIYADGQKLSETTSYTGDIEDGTAVYVFAGGPANKDFPVTSGTSVNLSESTGITGSGTWHVVDDDADAPGSQYTFGSPGQYTVTYTDDTKVWCGLLFVQPDITVYTAEGISATVTSDGLQTTISAEVEDGVEFNGIFTDGVELSETTSYTGELEDGTVVYVFSKERVNGDVHPAIGDTVDLSEVTGITGQGTWAVKTAYFEEIPEGNLSGSTFTVYSLGTYIVLYEEGDTYVCGLLTADLTGSFMLFDVSGKVGGTPVSGQIGSYYYLRNYSREAYFVKQTYSWSTGASGSSFYWTDESDTTGYTETNTGTTTITAADGTQHLCDVWSIQYYNSDGDHVYETQYIDAEQGFPVYAIEVSYFSGVKATSLNYTLNDYGAFEADYDWSVDYYADLGITVEISEIEGFGDTYTITASLTDSDLFMGWYDETGTCVSTDVSYTGTAAGSTTLYALSNKITAVAMDTETDADELFGVSGYEWYFLDSFPDSTPTALKDGKFTLTEKGKYLLIGESEDGGIITRISSGMSWSYNGDTYTLALNIDYEDYYHYATMNTDGRSFYSGVTKYASSATKAAYNAKVAAFVHADDVQNEVLEQIAQFVLANTEGLDEQGVADFILGMCQSSSTRTDVAITYKYDEDVHGQSEYFQYPLETLYLGTGDCEDTSILFCAIASYMGFDVCMYLFSNHIAAGVYLEEFTPSSTVSSAIYKGVYYLSDDEKPYYYCETTGKDWHVGDVWKEEAEKYYYWEIPVGEY